MNHETRKALFSSDSIEWGTPQYVFDWLSKLFGPFNLDAAASKKNAKCEQYFTKKDNSLSFDWARYETVFLNPPYGRDLENWVKKAKEEAEKGATVVVLLPVRTDTTWWHDYIAKADVLLFIRGRLKFQGAKNSAPFPNAVAVFYPPGTPGPDGLIVLHWDIELEYMYSKNKIITHLERGRENVREKEKNHRGTSAVVNGTGNGVNGNNANSGRGDKEPPRAVTLARRGEPKPKCEAPGSSKRTRSPKEGHRDASRAAQ